MRNEHINIPPHLCTSRNIFSSYTWKKMEIKFLSTKNHDFFHALLIFLRDVFINLFRCCSILQINRNHELGMCNQWLSAIIFRFLILWCEARKYERRDRSSILLAFRSRSFLASGATDVEYIHAFLPPKSTPARIREDIHEIAYLPAVKYEIKFIRLFRALIINRTIVAADRRRSRGL